LITEIDLENSLWNQIITKLSGSNSFLGKQGCRKGF